MPTHRIEISSLIEQLTTPLPSSSIRRTQQAFFPVAGTLILTPTWHLRVSAQTCSFLTDACSQSSSITTTTFADIVFKPCGSNPKRSDEALEILKRQTFVLFYLPYLSSIHEKANCIAILWTGSPHSLGSCLFRGLWATCLPHKGGASR